MGPKYETIHEQSYNATTKKQQHRTVVRIKEPVIPVDPVVAALMKKLTDFYKSAPNSSDPVVEEIWNRIQKRSPEMILTLSLPPNNTLEVEREWLVKIPVKIMGYDGLYTGQTRNSKAEGLGRFVANNGCVVEGNFLNGDIHGFQRIIYKDGHFGG